MKHFSFVILAMIIFMVGYSQPPTWSRSNAASVPQAAWKGRTTPKKFEIFKLNQTAMAARLSQAPSEKSVSVAKSGLTIELPDADGKLHTFSIVSAPVAAPGLLKKLNGAQSFSGQSTTDPNTVTRFSISKLGLNAIISSPGKPTVYIRSLESKTGMHIIFTDDGTDPESFSCTTGDGAATLLKSLSPLSALADANNGNDGNLRIFRLAIAASGTFSNEYDDDIANDDGDATRIAAVLAYQLMWVTDANLYLERDFGIRLEMIADNDRLIYLDSGDDPFSSDLNNETQTTIDTEIGTDNYDIGHLMNYDAGNNAGNAGDIGSICKASTKGSGYTTRSNWDNFDGYAAIMFTHELGHQCGANHTFTHDKDNDIAQMEPGSGSTIMSYGGNGKASAEFVIELRSKYFHAISIQQVRSYLASVSCGDIIDAGNTAPTADAGPDFTIPKSTAFTLKGNASDAESDALTFTWEQMDKVTEADGFPFYIDDDNTYGPSFRSRLPSSSMDRVLPADGVSDPWEILSSVPRTFKFRFTVRDNKVVGAQTNSDDVVITVADAGPLAITFPNGGESFCRGNQTITWDVNGTDADGLAPNVKILLSSDGGLTFPVVIAASTPNDGSFTYDFPCTVNTQARIKIEADGNIFFDVSDGNFTYGDGTKPTFTVPADITIYKDENCNYDALPSVTGNVSNVNDNCDTDPDISHTDNVVAGSCVGETIITRTWTVADDCGNSTNIDQTITVRDNIAPTFTVPGPVTIYKDENCEYDANPDITGNPTNVNDNCDPSPGITYTDVAVPGSCMGEEIITRTWKVTDDCGNSTELEQTITAEDNTPPEITNIVATPNSLWPPNHKMKEVVINYDVADNCSDAAHITTTLSIESNEPVNGTGDGDTEPVDYEVIDNHTVLLRAERAGTGDGRIYTITITSTDDCGNTSSETTEVYVAHNITAPLAGSAFKSGSTVNLSGVFQDLPGKQHTARWIIDETSTISGTVTSEPQGRKNGTVTGNYRFKEPGVYKLKMEVIDQEGSVSYATTSGDQEATIVIYDPSSGNAFGGGWFNSPAGALKSNPALTGKASFGFEVHYFKKASLPKGETRFEMKVGDFEFTALNYEYMSINGNRAQMKGSGRITGMQSGVSFILTVIDNGDADYVRMKIFNKNTGEVYYDNEPGKSEAADPSTVTGVNSVVKIINSEPRRQTNMQEMVSVEQLDLTITARPNPSSSSFAVRVNAPQDKGAVSLRVMDINGKVIEQHKVAARSTLVIGSSWKPGTYILEIQQNGSRKTSKLIKY